MVLKTLQYCTNLYKRTPTSAKTLQFSNHFCTNRRKFITFLLFILKWLKLDRQNLKYCDFYLYISQVKSVLLYKSEFFRMIENNFQRK
ncbi:hypothetical protein BpHYR1_029446 [Brachionus plicatilis]|uniref:Uncharacterized protein n=1 Tax=Brachionus plicatilis TaxID=10195 RepID=A0A3M7QTL0_BRAPC|nr:hypothetical protein BpHYR1_029446 [Brachionus plicatilis]